MLPSAIAPPPNDPASHPRRPFGLRILDVSEVTRAVRSAVRNDPRLLDLWVEGEIGRVTVSSAGHAYFALKDARNQLQCVWFKDDRLRSAFEARAGLQVVAHGRIDLYEPTGSLQLYVDAIQPSGQGDLAIRFEALKARLAAEGLFDPGRKRPLPGRPGTIAVVTSPSGAVWRDICQVLGRRWPLTRVLLVAARVQGEDAPGSIVRALQTIERLIDSRGVEGRSEGIPTVTIVARGGGSLEDLWPFNDERVVRAVVAHRLPVVSGIGHEVDVTLTDFAADVRAPTPSAAAELVVPDRLELAGAIRTQRRRLDGEINRRLAGATREVGAERRALERLHPAVQLVMARERAGLLFDRATRAALGRLAAERRTLDRTGQQLLPSLPTRIARDRARLARADGLDQAVLGRLTRLRGTFDAHVAALAVLGPPATLERGYAIVRRADDGAIVRDPSEAGAGTALRVRVAGGELPATADPR
ncbi:MAG: exodeoxyribonuclease VII large subunit [Chloroflexi bacterium]|nr:exodeoxyribonuclease VII large subunit [Chloroflexota bacterium]